MDQIIAVIGGDGRYLELIRQLQSLPNTIIYLVGFDKLEQGFIGLKQVEFEDLSPDHLDVVILPITGTDEYGNIETIFSNQAIKLSEKWFCLLKSSALIFTGITNPYLTKATRKANIVLKVLLDRDDVAIYNSIPTAEGTVMMAIEHTDYTIHSSRIIVVGFGRVGNTVANKFSAFGADVSVVAKGSADLARINEMGLKAIPLHEIHMFTDQCDLLINTIPAHVITRKVIEQMPLHGLIIDLASNPGGTDFDFAMKRGINAILAPSLPGIVAPKTSGRILADVIKKVLLEERGK